MAASGNFTPTSKFYLRHDNWYERADSVWDSLDQSLSIEGPGIDRNDWIKERDWINGNGIVRKISFYGKFDGTTKVIITTQSASEETLENLKKLFEELSLKYSSFFNTVEAGNPEEMKNLSAALKKLTAIEGKHKGAFLYGLLEKGNWREFEKSQRSEAATLE